MLDNDTLEHQSLEYEPLEHDAHVHRYPPFYGESDQEIFASVRHGYFDFPSPEWDNISTEAKDFITQLLQKDPAARMTATQSIAHRWFARGDGDDADAGDDSKKGQINMQVYSCARSDGVCPGERRRGRGGVRVFYQLKVSVHFQRWLVPVPKSMRVTSYHPQTTMHSQVAGYRGRRYQPQIEILR